MDKINIGISARHVHLSKEHLEILFGKGYELTVFKPLSQPGQYASNEKVKIVTLGGKEVEARILGPVRKESQVEVSKGDVISYKFETPEVSVPVRSSGDIKGSGKCKLVGPKGEVFLEEGVIIADRHIHMSLEDAAHFGVKDKDIVSIKVLGNKPAILGKVLVRVNASFALDCHLDTDDGNACNIKTGDTCQIIKEISF